MFDQALILKVLEKVRFVEPRDRPTLTHRHPPRVRTYIHTDGRTDGQLVAGGALIPIAPREITYAAGGLAPFPASDSIACNCSDYIAERT